MASARHLFYDFLIRLLAPRDRREATAHVPLSTEDEVASAPEPIPHGPHVIQPMTWEAAWFYQFCIYYRATVLGPIPFGQTERIRVEMEYIFEPNLDAALAAVWEQIDRLCGAYEHPFDPDEWDVVYLGSVNAN